MSFANVCLSPDLIYVPELGDCNEIIWISTKPKRQPWPYTNLIICSFYYSPRQRDCSYCNFHNRLQESLDFVTTKYPNVNLFIAGNANKLSFNYLCKDQKLKQIFGFPSTKVGTSLDVICTNLKIFHKCPIYPIPLGGSYHFMLHLKPLLVLRTNYSVSEFLYRPITSQALFDFGSWIMSKSWDDVLSCVHLNSKVSFFQAKLMTNYQIVSQGLPRRYFPQINLASMKK